MSNKTTLQQLSNDISEMLALKENKEHYIALNAIQNKIKTIYLPIEKNDIIDANYRGQLYSIVEKQASVLESENYFLKIFNQ